MSEYLNLFKQTLEHEAQAILRVKDLVTEQQANQLVEIYKSLLEASGTLFFCGVGKSGIIAQKLAATFTSLGLPSSFLHPVEALHGDLGRVKMQDAMVFLSKSGTTEEILKLIPYLNVAQSRRIALIGNVNSEIGKHSGLVFNCSVEREASLNNLAPTTSSTTALAMGDAMAVVYEKFVGLSKEGFAMFHPGGLLGKSLRLKVKDLMCAKSVCPVVGLDTPLKQVLIEMTKFNVGASAVCSEDGKLKGVIVEGDIRRALMKDLDPMSLIAVDIMTANPITSRADDQALIAFELMEKRKSPISVLPVLDENSYFVGIIRLHDLLKEGF
jgi:arabinose-5-phosphate isomerase